MATPLARAAVCQGIGFSMILAAILWGQDAIEGTVSAWPRAALLYGGLAVVGGAAYGLIWRWLERRYGRSR